MIDLINFIVALICMAILVLCLILIKKRKEGIVASICAFIIGMAFHSILLHEKIRQKWNFIWNHDEPVESSDERDDP